MNMSSPIQGVGSALSTSTPLWNPMTRAINTTGFTAVKSAVQLIGHSTAEVCPAVQFSDDGIEWNGSTVALTWQGSANYVNGSSTEWHYGDDFVTFSSGNIRRFCRFGLLCQNVSGSDLANVTAQLHLQMKPVQSRVVETGMIPMVTEDGPNRRFYAGTGALPAGQFREVRSSWELCDRSSGGFEVEAAFQMSEDGVEWDNAQALRATSSGSSNVGWDWGTTFASTLDDAPFVRFGFSAIRPSATKAEFGVGRLIVEGRGS